MAAARSKAGASPSGSGPAAPPHAASEAPARLPGLARILIVDDDERNLFAAQTALEELGHQIIVARSGEEALKHLLQDDFAVILLDLHMPGMDGYETAAFIRQRRRTSRTPIVFLTAVFRDEAHVFQAYSAGAVDVVFKPIDPFILRSKVQVLVDLHLKTLEVQNQAEHTQRLLDENVRVLREKAQAEAALRRTQERQQAILKSLPIVFHSRSIEPPFAPLFLSNNVEALTGFPPEAFLAQPDFGSSRIHPEDLPAVVKAVSGAVQTGAYSCEFRWRCADGEYRRLLDQGVLAPSADGGPGREIWGALLDVTERRSLEEQLTHARKMEAVGQLTGGVAHDFNNLLTVIVGNLDLLDRRSEHDPRTQRQLAAVRYAAERGGALTRQLLAFSRRQHLSPVALDVRQLIGNFAPLLKQAVGDAVTVELDLGARELCAEVDPAQLETALLNLAVNARDAMPRGGPLQIAASAQRETPRGASEDPGQPDGWVRIDVRDSGVGIARASLERIFEPFFTTKEVGKGSGLGLSQVYGFVQQSGGHIAVESEPGAGACFSLYLRASDKQAEAPAERPSRAAADKPARGRLLVVEDDQDVLAVTLEMLSELGYEVATACDAAAALEKLEGGEPVDLLFSDVVMPGGCNGAELAKRARVIRPGLKVLLSSGYVGEASSLVGGAFEMIDKPYERTALAARLAAILEGSKGGPDGGPDNGSGGGRRGRSGGKRQSRGAKSAASAQAPYEAQLS
jgi:signal transduction histidine kinase/CheY-like chemotaxis protein